MPSFPQLPGGLADASLGSRAPAGWPCPGYGPLGIAHIKRLTQVSSDPAPGCPSCRAPLESELPLCSTSSPAQGHPHSLNVLLLGTCPDKLPARSSQSVSRGMTPTTETDK